MVFKLPKPKRRVNEKMTLEALHRSAETYREMYDNICKKNNILQKQLDIAVGTLRCYGNPNNWDGNRFTNFFATWQLARNNLDKIEELNK